MERVEPMDQSGAAGVERRKGLKRKNCDVEGNEQPDSKKNKATPEVSRKHVVLCFIIHAHVSLMKMLGLSNEFKIDEVADVTSIICTLHTITRWSFSTGGQVAFKVSMDSKPSIVGCPEGITMGSLKEEFARLVKLYGLNYEKQLGKDENDSSILTSILALTIIYKGRISEVQTGNLKFVYKKSKDQAREIGISIYGLDNGAAAFMGGANLNPTLQSSLKQSLGPMTIALQLCNSRDRKYQESWMAVFYKVFANVPRREEIATLLAGSVNTHREILRLLYQFCMLGATRSSYKAAIPVSFLLIAQSIQNAASYTKLKEPTGYLKSEDLCPLLQKLDFSGRGFWHLWNFCASQTGWTIRADKKVMTDKYAAQIVAHAVIGTHNDDLAIPKMIFETDFVTREEMGNCFVNRNTTDEVTFELYSAKNVCKLASAAQTRLLDGSEGQYARCCVLSGFAVQRVTLDGKFLKKLKESPVIGLSPPGVDSILRTLMDTKDKVVAKLALSDRMYGTSWFKFDPNDEDAYGTQLLTYTKRSGKYFFERNDE